MDKLFRRKIITILVLCGCIVCGIVYLTFRPLFYTGKKEIVTTPSSSPNDILATSLPVETKETIISYDTESEDSLYRIVNEKHKIDKNYVPENLRKIDAQLVNVTKEFELREDAYNALIEMYEVASSSGYQMRVISGYRSYEEQEKLYEYYVTNYGFSWAEEIDDKPGESEHQLGLCVDIGLTSGECELDACFADTTLYKWLHANAYKYGFIERYPTNKQDVTGIIFSSWHYRYVGKEMAKKIFDSGLTMEEYFEID